MLNDGDTSKVSIDQLKALEKLLPDAGQVDMLKSYSGDTKMLGTAENFFSRLIQLKQCVCEHVVFDLLHVSMPVTCMCVMCSLCMHVTCM